MQAETTRLYSREKESIGEENRVIIIGISVPLTVQKSSVDWDKLITYFSFKQKHEVLARIESKSLAL